MDPLAPMDVAGRLGRLRQRLPEAGCDALVVTNLTNIRYLTGFTGSAGILVVLAGDALLLTDGRYATQAPEQVAAAGAPAEVGVGTPARQHERIATALSGIARVGLEAGHITWAAQRAQAQALPAAELVPTDGLVEQLRRVKDAGELARMQAAAAIADEALAAVRPMLLTRPTERAVAIELDFAMRRLGAGGPSFDTIVASGPNSAKPHARPSDRRIAEGELVVIDFGATVDGYRSDMTRTVSVGEPATDVRRRMVEVVAAAQAAGVAAVAGGVSTAEVDAACRQRIAEAGWADAFVHGTGHGVGLDIHEQPILNNTTAATLEAGYVVTVEPGVYLPEHGGVRIEDSVVVTDGGCRPLTLASKELVIS